MIKRCFLKPLNNEDGKYPVIEIGEEKQFIGRSRETNISDGFCSRKQVCVKVNMDDEYVLIKSEGTNPSALNGFLLESGKPYEAMNGDILEIVSNRFMYEVVFEPSSTLSSTNGKRKSDENEAVTSKKLKPSMSNHPPASDDKWEKIEGGKLYIYTAKGVKSSDKIACYDMDGTLIKTKSGNVFPKDCNDWQILYPEVPKKLKDLQQDGFKLVIFTNQAGLSKGKTKIEDFKAKIENVTRKLGVPLQVFISTGNGLFRKPMTGMWQTLCEHKNDSIMPDLMESFYVGDAAGRPERKYPEKRKKDHSCVDRLMALNIGLQFHTPEEFFQNAKKIDWTKPEFDPTRYVIPKTIIEPSDAKLDISDCEVIIMVGIPGSGKSFFTKNYLENKGYKIINRDKLGTWQKCVAAMESELGAKHKCVIDNTNPDKESRKRYILAAKKYNVPVRCFVMNTSIKHAKHNNLFRELTDTSHSPVNEMVFNSFKSKFQEPKREEGFTEILKINFIPKFQNDTQEKLYKMYLLAN